MPSRPALAALLVALLLAAPIGAQEAIPTEAGALPPAPVLRSWIEGFKTSERGPFELIRWFCFDGRIRPARVGCGGENQGVQHGDWNERARLLREHGYQIANVLVALDPNRFVGPNADLDAWKQVLLERFLVGFDEGWIFRGAFGYRGAFQIEDEERAARQIVLAMLTDPRWRDPARFFLLRESVRLLPLAVDETSAADVRAKAMALASRDPAFAPLRAKIHSFPDGGDAERVREFAEREGRPALAAQYEALAHEIEALYAPQGAAVAVLELAPLVGDEEMARQLREKSVEFGAEVNMGRRFAAAAKLMQLVRDSFPGIRDPETALVALMTSLALEREAYAAGAEALTKIDSSSRRSRLWLGAYAAEAAYGAGFIGARELAEVESAVRSIESRNPALREYREVVQYLGRLPEWSARRLAFHFGPQVEHLATLDPLVRQYPADRLRGSPVLFFGGIVDGLVRDVNELAGVTHEIFGEQIGSGLRALNPGIARGTLRDVDGRTRFDRLDRDGIYLLPETTPDISPVAGILTRGEGSSLSHVQLLARDLGIPNVVVHDGLVPHLEGALGTRVVLAVSPGGVVRLARDGPQWDEVFGAGAAAPAAARPAAGEPLIQPDLAKLDLSVTEPLPLGQLRAWDSGRVCGPKGANLGELRHAFGSAVPDGVVIPFGAFRRLLDQPIEPGGPPAFEWLRARYDEIQAARDRARRQRLTEETLARIRAWIAEVPLPPDFQLDLEWALRERFGPTGTYGVFVRSDTNVEDLPGFSGAGLNRTVPNVVGTEAILEAVRTVWASPFTERSFAWRQAHMRDPEYVFPAVVVQEAFPSEKSGVLVTVDVESGDPRWLTIAANEGVGGAVEGQAAESLRVERDTGIVRLLAPAAAPYRTVLDPAGGVRRLPASGDDAVLEPNEILQLVQLVRELPTRLPSLRVPPPGAAGAAEGARDDERAAQKEGARQEGEGTAPAGVLPPLDIEFAFGRGRLALLQVRPFNESQRAHQSAYLASLDSGLRARGDLPIWIGGRPGQPDPAMAAAEQQEAERLAAEEAERAAAERRRRRPWTR